MHKVFIIDDEPWSREVVKALGQWESFNMSVIGEAEDGNDGLKQIGDLKPDLVITDMRMPGIDGAKLLKTINEQYPTLKIIVMSGYDDFIYVKQAIHSHAVEYLLKPINSDELNAALEQCGRELEKAKNTNITLGLSLVFEAPAVLERYQVYRQLIYGSLLELNKSAVFKIFEEFKAFMENILSERNDENVLARVGHDFIIILEEFMSKNEMSFSHIWNKKNREWTEKSGWESLSEVTSDMCWFYGKAIDAMIATRRNKNHLDPAEVQAYIDWHYQEPISLETLAQHFFISKEHLCRVYKSYTGENVSDYILRKRMEKAKSFIVDKGLAIKNVSQMLGYEDIAYFYRVFKKHFGFTPGKLRKEETYQ